MVLPVKSLCVLSCFNRKISSFIPVLYIRIVLDSFYLLIFYSEKVSTWIWRLLFGNLSNIHEKNGTREKSLDNRKVWIIKIQITKLRSDCMEFLCSFIRHHVAGKPFVGLWSVSCFLWLFAKKACLIDVRKNKNQININAGSAYV